MWQRLGEGPRSDVLRCLLENFGERIRLGSRKPVPDDVLVSAAAKEHRPRLLLTCHRCLSCFGVTCQRLGSPAACITPSRERFSTTTSLLICPPCPVLTDSGSACLPGH